MAQIRSDLFPSIVTIAPPGLLDSETVLQSAPPTPGTRQVHSSRIIVTENQVLIAVDGPTGPQLVFREDYDPATLVKSLVKSEDSYLTTVSGKRMAFRKDEHCGCGSRLRGWNPFRGIMSSVKDPTE